MWYFALNKVFATCNLYRNTKKKKEEEEKKTPTRNKHPISELFSHDLLYKRKRTCNVRVGHFP